MSLVEDGSPIVSVRIKHFLAVLRDYKFSDELLASVVNMAIEREKEGVKYDEDLNRLLSGLARKLS